MNVQPKPRYKWTPMQRSYSRKPLAQEVVAECMQALQCDEAEARRILLEEFEKNETWINDIYQVQVRRGKGDTAHINIRRRDGGPIMRDWRHFQRIKNDVIGPECEAIELYPAESRLVDTSNKYHLWACTDPTFRFPIGFPDRSVRYDDSDVPGLRQRPL